MLQLTMASQSKVILVTCVSFLGSKASKGITLMLIQDPLCEDSMLPPLVAMTLIQDPLCEDSMVPTNFLIIMELAIPLY